MKHWFKLLISLTVFYFTTACSDKNEAGSQTHSAIKENIKPFPELEKINWLLGTWEGALGHIHITETWKPANDSSFSGTCFFVKAGDTLSSEKIQLLENKNGLFYVPTIKEQNGGLPVEFRMTYSGDSGIIFKNPSHDFPQKIHYMKKGADSLIVFVSGTRELKEETQRFPFKRAGASR